MILTGAAILRAYHLGAISIEPFTRSSINPNSYNFHLYPSIMKKDSHLGKWKSLLIPADGVLLKPGRLYLGATNEIIGSDQYVVTLLGKSSIGRLGLFLNVTANLGHLGACSRWTLELTAVQPIRVYPGLCIGQVAFWKASDASTFRYEGRYHEHRRPHPNLDRSLTRQRR
jgi:dCTP deaminase